MSTSVLEKKSKQSKNGKLNITPLQDRIIVQRVEAEERTAGGIILPDTAKEKPQEGIVLAVGPGKKDYAMQCKTGDRILFGKYAGQDISYEGHEYLVMREEDVLAILH